MSKAIENLSAAQKYAMSIRPKVGGFPYLAEALRLAGITHNQWHLPSCQSLYLTKYGPVISQGTPLVTGTYEVAKFDREALIQALRTIAESLDDLFEPDMIKVWAERPNPALQGERPKDFAKKPGGVLIMAHLLGNLGR